jgi:hypothetical protein
MLMRRRDSMPECVEQGDYVLIDVCASCNVQGKCLAAGGGVEFHYSGCTANIPRRGIRAHLQMRESLAIEQFASCPQRG